MTLILPLMLCTINKKLLLKCRFKHILVRLSLIPMSEKMHMHIPQFDLRCSINDIPKISVIRLDEKWVTADNRRLWVFRELERLGKCTNIQVEQTSCLPKRKMTSRNGGVAVRVRGQPGGFWHKRQTYNPESSNMFALLYIILYITCQIVLLILTTVVVKEAF